MFYHEFHYNYKKAADNINANIDSNESKFPKITAKMVEDLVCEYISRHGGMCVYTAAPPYVKPEDATKIDDNIQFNGFDLGDEEAVFSAETPKEIYNQMELRGVYSWDDHNVTLPWMVLQLDRESTVGVIDDISIGKCLDDIWKNNVTPVDMTVIHPK